MIPLFKPYMPQDISEGVNEILYSGQLAFGKWGKLFEQKLTEFLGTESLLIVNSYSSALNITLDVLNITAGDEIIMSPMCCLQSTQPLSARGLKIVWADIDPETGTLDPESVKQKITKNTKAIFHNMHLGYVGYIDEINKIARQHGIFTIDDCVDGMGQEYKGNKIGNCGSDATVISFHAVRLPNAMESGAIVFKDPGYVEKAKIKRDLGLERQLFRDAKGEISEKYDVTIQGYGATANEVSSYIGLKQMEILPELIAKQRENARKWSEYLKNENLPCTPIKNVPDSDPIYWVFGMFTEKKDEMMDYFRNKGFWASTVHLNNNRYSLFGEYVDLPGVNDFYSKFLAIPSGWWHKL
ncbi:DegT/DnrJ/EryC1/StrS family aminotransferase [Chryseobacterium defluvii]|uniref:dTDP-4-amino-4,6-dideoxygalactose transaminase n=1 Tax=Chryseobacterium defluvii TaxID=160396 RepID=A0A495SMQ4_9FLAO|nr:aminotransferase class V-fold PLP-dependent enzyme [Chryseobacterium defluvii]RKT01337.1 dTDP-4-amino-4,6-dideoxygalactose transaminase [Chryseobacterium defluvii]